MPISVSQSSASTTMISGTMFFHNGSISLLLNSSHPVVFDLECVVLSQSTCIVNKTNIGYMINVFSSTQEVVELYLSDHLGNNKTIFVNTTADLSSGHCVPSQFAQVFSGELIIPSNRNTVFTCTDDSTGINNVGWDTSQGFVQWTSLGNGPWSAPAILYPNANIVVTRN